MRNREEKVTAGEAFVRIMEEHEKEVKEESRIEAERLLAQVEDALARLCHDSNDVSKAAIQLVAERSSHISTYTPVQFVGMEAKRYKEGLGDMTPDERQELELFV